MIIEICLILAFLFFVAVFFYKQALEGFDISQIEADQLEKLPNLLTEYNLIVLRSLPPTQLWNPSTIREIPRIQDAPYGNLKLADIMANPKVAITPLFPSSSEKLADHVGIQTWLETTWLPKIIDSEWKRFLFSARAEVAIGAKGLRKTVAYSTMIMPTEGDLVISVMPESSETYLPKVWQGKPFASIKRAEAPLIGEIKFMDIKVRNGSALFVPPHWIVDIQGASEVPWFIWAEFHHPLSKLVQAMSKN